MLHLTSGSRLSTWLMSVFRLLSALVTFFTLGFVYTSLEFWASEKDLSLKGLWYGLYSRILELPHKIVWSHPGSSDLYWVLSRGSVVCAAIIMVSQLSLIPKSDWKINFRGQEMWASDFKSPSEIGPPMPMPVKITGTHGRRL